jgi:hypothetical protein
MDEREGMGFVMKPAGVSLERAVCAEDTSTSVVRFTELGIAGACTASGTIALASGMIPAMAVV